MNKTFADLFLNEIHRLIQKVIQVQFEENRLVNKHSRSNSKYKNKGIVVTLTCDIVLARKAQKSKMIY